jgi:hypothetical protein
MSTTGNNTGTVSCPGSMCVDMNAREVNIVAAHNKDSLTLVSNDNKECQPVQAASSLCWSRDLVLPCETASIAELEIQESTITSCIR